MGVDLIEKAEEAGVEVIGDGEEEAHFVDVVDWCAVRYSSQLTLKRRRKMELKVENVSVLVAWLKL